MMISMDRTVAVRECAEYGFNEVYSCVAEIYRSCRGPSLSGKRVLIKPNILSDDSPSKCISTHPVVVEAMIRFAQAEGASAVAVGDSPAVHLRGFKPVKSGIYEVCRKTGAEWTDFTKKPSELTLRNGRIKIASAVKRADIIISLPKLKNHELVYFTGAIKNTLGLVPAFSKARQHALHQDRESFSRFLVELNEALMPSFFLLDGIMGMEGRGPGQGDPVRTGFLAGSSNPLALDIIAGSLIGYDHIDLPVCRFALSRGIWLASADEIEYDGPELEALVKSDFKKIPVRGNTNISLGFIKNRIPFLRKLDKRPVFLNEKCTGCGQCISICPTSAISLDPVRQNHVTLTDRECIRCFCCSEVCPSNAIQVRRKLIGA